MATVLSPKACAAWELRGSKSRHGSCGRGITTEIQLVGGHTLTALGSSLTPQLFSRALGRKTRLDLGADNAPSSAQSSAERQAFYGAVVTGFGNGDRRNAVLYCPDAHAPAGVGVHTRRRLAPLAP